MLFKTTWDKQQFSMLFKATQNLNIDFSKIEYLGHWKQHQITIKNYIYYNFNT